MTHAAMPTPIEHQLWHVLIDGEQIRVETTAGQIVQESIANTAEAERLATEHNARLHAADVHAELLRAGRNAYDRFCKAFANSPPPGKPLPEWDAMCEEARDMWSLGLVAGPPREGVSFCAYCNYEIAGRPDEAITAHIKACPKHPLRAAEQKVELLRKALLAVLGVDEAELPQHADALRAIDLPPGSEYHAQQQAAEIAVQALIDTQPTTAPA